MTYRNLLHKLLDVLNQCDLDQCVLVRVDEKLVGVSGLHVFDTGEGTDKVIVLETQHGTQD